MRKGKLKLPKGMQHALFVFDGKVREVCQAYLPRNEVMCRWDTMIGGEQTIVEAAIPFADYPNCLPVLRKEAIKKFKGIIYLTPMVENPHTLSEARAIETSASRNAAGVALAAFPLTVGLLRAFPR